MDDFERPVDKVYRSLPGTLRELMERTGYPAQVILEATRRLTAEGTVVACVMGERDLESPTGWEPSRYVLRAPVDGR